MSKNIEELYRKLHHPPSSKQAPQTTHKLSKELKMIKAKNLDRIFLQLEEPSFQSKNSLTKQEIDLLKLDKEKYLEFLASEHKRIYPEELITFKGFRVRPKVKVTKERGKVKLAYDDLGLNDDDDKEESSDILDSVYTQFIKKQDMGSNSNDDRDNGSYGEDDYD